METKSLSESKRITTLLADENKKLREKCERLEKLARDMIIDFEDWEESHLDGVRVSSAPFLKKFNELVGAK